MLQSFDNPFLINQNVLELLIFFQTFYQVTIWRENKKAISWKPRNWN